MKIPISWLKDYVAIPVSVEELASRLTLAGLEVEGIDYIGGPKSELPWDPERIVVGDLLAVRPHPDADRLVLADVDYGGAEIETVVTGAPSVCDMVGQTDIHRKVAFAMEGAELYDGHAEGKAVVRLKRAKIRGVPSRAMVCSEKELGLAEEQEDIIYLPDDYTVGAPLRDYLADAILQVDIKGPVGHLYSVFGIAREVSALIGSPLEREATTVLDEKPLAPTPSPGFVDLQIDDPDLCPRYSAALIRDVAIEPSPFWMQTRLRRAGMRPINNVVDVTNYVMLELGQPLHAFDYRALRSLPEGEQPAIVIRRANPGEKMATLDKVVRTFDEEMLLIADGQGPIAVAGVMGGLESEVTETTNDILLESANFHFLSIRRTSRLLGLASEASQRFGRQVDPGLTARAAARAAWLMGQLAKGQVSSQIGDLYPGEHPPRRIDLDPRYADRVLGVEIPRDEMARILESLEFQVEMPEEEPAEAFSVVVPTHRQDVSEAIDLVEEVSRIWGYDNFKGTLLRDVLPPHHPTPRLDMEDRVRDILTGCGLDEAITYSLIDYEDEAKLHIEGNAPPLDEHLQVQNPLSAERATLRRVLLPSLLTATRDNLRFGDRVAVFEIGNVYVPVEGEVLPDEPHHLAIVMTGPREARSWLPGQQRSPVDFFDLKGIVEALLDRLGAKASFRPGDHPAFHPGRCATVLLGEDLLGSMGELHPLAREAFDLPDQPICGLEFDMGPLLIRWGKAHKMTPLSNHPPVYEDLAIVVSEEVSAEQVRDLILQAGVPLVRSVTLFDLYRGDQIGRGRKSLAYRLTYQANDRTLTDKIVSKTRQKIIKRLARKVDAVLRS